METESMKVTRKDTWSRRSLICYLKDEKELSLVKSRKEKEYLPEGNAYDPT